MNRISRRIEFQTVPNDLSEILLEFLSSGIVAFFKLLSNSRDVHWLLDDCKVVWNVEGYRIDRDHKWGRELVVLWLLDFDKHFLAELELGGVLFALRSYRVRQVFVLRGVDLALRSSALDLRGIPAN